MKQLEWVNCAKFIAIIAVLVDHTNCVLYGNPKIAMASYFSVALFIYISGYLNYSFHERHNYNYSKAIVYSCKKIAYAYLLAVFVYTIVINHYFDVLKYIKDVLLFNKTGPFYYVMLYIQLMMISPVLYKILKSIGNRIVLDGLAIIFIAILAYLSTNYTNICGIYGGGGKLFGGTFLFIFYIGMIFNKYKIFENDKKSYYIILFVISTMINIIMLGIIFKGYSNAIDSILPMVDVDVPRITYGIYSLAIFVWCYSFFSMCSWFEITKFVVKYIGWIGKHTLYIFLYHRLWINYYAYKKYFGIYIYTLDNRLIKRVIYFGIMIFIPIIFENIVLFVVNIYNKRKNS